MADNEGRMLLEMLRNHHSLEAAKIGVRLATEHLARVALDSDGTAGSTLLLQVATAELETAKLAEDIARNRQAEWREEMDR